MAAQLNHTIVAAHDKQASAEFLANVLGLPEPEPEGPFVAVRAGNDVTLDFSDTSGDIVSQHYAFYVSEQEFDNAFEQIRARDLPYWADPAHRERGEINTRGGGRGVYFDDPNGHNLEILTRT